MSVVIGTLSGLLALFISAALQYMRTRDEHLKAYGAFERTFRGEDLTPHEIDQRVVDAIADRVDQPDLMRAAFDNALEPLIVVLAVFTSTEVSSNVAPWYTLVLLALTIIVTVLTFMHQGWFISSRWRADRGARYRVYVVVLALFWLSPILLHYLLRPFATG